MQYVIIVGCAINVSVNLVMAYVLGKCICMILLQPFSICYTTTMLKQKITQLIEKVLAEKGIADANVMVDYPMDANHGDYASNIALSTAKKLGRNPMELAEEFVEALRQANQEAKLFDKIAVAKPGFINFLITKEQFIKNINNFTYPDIGRKRKVVVEYSSPNIAKPFTIGHLRSTIIGDALANLLEAVGYEVYRDNHLGDWGTQFGKQIYAIKTWGDEKEIEQSERPVKLLVDLYVKFHDEAEKNPQLEDEARAWFKKLEDGDSEARRLWEKCIEWSWKEFNVIYEKLNVSFTENNGRGYGESYFEDKMKPILEELKDKHLMKEGKDGAQLVFYPNDKYPPLMILKKDGATLYATRDLATDKFRINRYGKDVVILNEVGAEQSLYFRQLYELESMLGWFKSEQRTHVKHGLYRFKEGKMSTRKGNAIWLEDVLDEANKRAFNLAKEGFEFEGDTVLTVSNKHRAAAHHIKGLARSINTQEKVAMGALKWNDLKRSPEQDIAFEWDEVLNMKGNSGPYMQYVYVRTQSILSKAKELELIFNKLTNVNKTNSEERELLRLLAQFDEVIYEASNKLSTVVLTNYLFELAQGFNLFYQKHLILKGEEDFQAFRLGLTLATGKIIKQGLNLLGIEAPERM